MRAAKVLLSLFLALMAAGCWGSRETDEIAYVLAMGFDKGPGPGKNIIVTFQIANPKSIAGQAAGGGGGEDKAGPMINVSTMAPLPIGAFNLVNTVRSREISLLHTNAYIFSEELAREGLHHYMAPLNRHRETRGTALVFVSRGSAREFLEKNQPVLEISPSKQYEMITMVNNLHGLSSVVRFHEFYQVSKSLSQEPVAPLVSINKNGLDVPKLPILGKLGDYLAGNMPSNKGLPQFIGTAVFKGDKMVGQLTGDETRHLNMITGKLERSFQIIDDPKKPGEPLGFSLFQARKPEIRVRFSEEVPVIKVDIYLEPELVGVTSGINYETPRLKKFLERHLAELIKMRCLELVTRTQEEFRADIFGFGRYARMNFLTHKQWDKAGWKKVYPLARVDINVHVKIRRTGLMLKTEPVHK